MPFYMGIGLRRPCIKDCFAIPFFTGFYGDILPRSIAFVRVVPVACVFVRGGKALHSGGGAVPLGVGRPLDSGAAHVSVDIALHELLAGWASVRVVVLSELAACVRGRITAV